MQIATTARVPLGAAAALAALHFREPRMAALASLSDAEWRAALDYTDRSQLTLPLRGCAAGAMPEWVRERADACFARNLERVKRASELYGALDGCLKAAGIEYVALKGLAHCPEFGSSASERMQYDIDLYTPKERAGAAQTAVMGMGFSPLTAMERFPTDHLPALIRKTGWEWRGDFFDPEIPLAVEIHFRFWNERLERMRAPGVEEFWERRVVREVAGVPMGALCPVDALGFASLHLLKHVVQGSGRAFHIYEVARFLELHADDGEFWREWQTLHAPEMRRLEAAMFRLAREWFGCRTGAVAEEEMERLPAATARWFEEFAWSPAERVFHPAKNELWLHLSLLDSPWDALAVARRRLLPLNLPGPVDAVHIPNSQLTVRRRVLKGVRWVRHAARRMWHHTRTLPGAVGSGVQWYWKPNALGREFWLFLAAAILYNFALFIFVLLFNLRLLELGYREDFLGVVSSAGTMGCVAGTLPAASLARRFGLRATLLTSIGGTACLAALKALATGRAELAGLAFAAGLLFSGWAVVMAPTVAAAVGEKRRTRAFSFFYAMMFATGIAGAWIGGRLPLWVGGKQMALLTAAGLAALALLPASRLRVQARAPEKAKNVYPRMAFMARYLIPYAIFNFATGSFNPFFNAYLARLGYGAEGIGTAYSLSKVAQVAALLVAPLVFRRVGLANGVAAMTAAAAAGLAWMAAASFGGGAAVAFVVYMAFQWMSEPGLSALLMSGVKEHERGGAAAMNYLTMFGANALAALVGGQVVSRFGYGAGLAGSAGLAILAAVLFQGLLGERAAARSALSISARQRAKV